MTFQDRILASVNQHPGITIRDLAHDLGDIRALDVKAALWRLDANLKVYETSDRVWPTTRGLL